MGLHQTKKLLHTRGKGMGQGLGRGIEGMPSGGNSTTKILVDKVIFSVYDFVFVY